MILPIIFSCVYNFLPSFLDSLLFSIFFQEACFFSGQCIKNDIKSPCIAYRLLSNNRRYIFVDTQTAVKNELPVFRLLVQHILHTIHVCVTAVCIFCQSSLYKSELKFLDTLRADLLYLLTRSPAV